MHVGWSFLDTTQAAARALTAYSKMEFILEHTAEEMDATRSQMTSACSPSYSDMPHGHDPKAGENRMLRGIDKLDLLADRYRQAEEYMKWFRPAWEQLGDDDQYVLRVFFCGADDDAVGAVADHFGIERTSAYSKRKRAIKRLAVLLYGCV